MEIADRHADVDDGKLNDWMRVKVLAESGIEKAPVMPSELDTKMFLIAWQDWLEYRRQRKFAKYTAIGLSRTLKAMAFIGPQRACAAIYHSITQNYQGIYEERQGSAAQNTRSTGTLNGAGRYNLGSGVHGGKRPEAHGQVPPVG